MLSTEDVLNTPTIICDIYLRNKTTWDVIERLFLYL